MKNDIVIHQIKDWSALDASEDCWKNVDFSRPEDNFGIHLHNGKLYSGGYVGVGRLTGINGSYIKTTEKDEIVISDSRFDMNPWQMLETIMSDDEYSDYFADTQREKPLFKIFYDQPVIKLPQGADKNEDILHSLSFVFSCYDLCRKGLKKNMVYLEGNYSSKVRGKIDIYHNIRVNTSKGRNDRFYCRYIDFTEDNIENRILKCTLIKCSNILKKRFCNSSVLSRRIAFSMNSLRHVKTVQVEAADFLDIDVSGFYMYYKNVLQQAKLILSKKYYSYKNDQGQVMSRSVITVPFVINMEKLFEFYARSVLRRSIDHSKYFIEEYSKRIFIQACSAKPDSECEKIHLIDYVIPDIIIRKVEDGSVAAVIDAKYKACLPCDREDTHQLLAYVLLTGSKKCGFIFPGKNSELKIMKTTKKPELPLIVDSLNYFEFFLCNDKGIAPLIEILNDNS